MMYGNGWFRDGHSMFNGYGLTIWHYLFMLGVVVVIVVLLLWARKKNMNNNTNSNNHALMILKELYAKGDISEEEYLKRKNVLER